MATGTCISLTTVDPRLQIHGNIFARKLRLICEDTRNFFPSCEEPESRSQSCPVQRPEIGERGKAEEPQTGDPEKPRKKLQTAKEEPLPRSKMKVFMKWVVPPWVSGDGSGEVSPPEVQTAREISSNPLPMSPVKSKSMTPRLPALPSCPPSRARTNVSAARSFVSQRSAHSSAAAAPPASHVVVAPKAQEMLRYANPTERRIIEKALLLADHSAASDPLRRTLQPDAELRVRKWLETATPEERRIALTFFNKLAGHHESAGASKEQRNKVLQVLKTLENGKAGSEIMQSHPAFSKGDGQPQLRHLRLLTPGSRRNRWMHTTWHHMPPYKDCDPVDNRRSHFLQAQRMLQRHFVIHPDWGR